MDLNDPRFVTGYSTATGRKQRVPRHWIGHPVLGRGLRLAPSEEQPEPDMTGTEPTEKWSFDQLRAYATDRGVDLAGARSKAAVLDAITTHLDTPTTDTAPVSVDTPPAGD